MSSPASDAPAPARAAAAVILVRERPGSGEVEVYMVERHHRTSFMSSAYVFPGGAAESHERDLRVTAARELFEEAGVLLSRAPVDAATRANWRQRLHGREPIPDEMRSAFEAALDLGAMHYYAEWITPSVVPKRFQATFYLAVLGAGETPSIDEREAVAATWVTPAEGLLRARELRLHPPQLRTLFDMRADAEAGLDALIASARKRAASAHPILPRHAAIGAGEGANGTRMGLLLPWDPDYLSAGVGEALSMPAGHPLAVGPSRFVLEDKSWKHISAADSLLAE